MKRRILYETKEESNARREAEFLALDPSERVAAFFRLCRQMAVFTVDEREERNKDNFIVRRPDADRS